MAENGRFSFGTGLDRKWDGRDQLPLIRLMSIQGFLPNGRYRGVEEGSSRESPAACLQDRQPIQQPRMRVNIRKLTFIPEGRMIVARQFMAWDLCQSKIRPVGHGLILTHGWLVVLIVARLSDPITPSLRDGSLFERIPGNKLPGYDHSVPPGQRLVSLC